MCGSGTFLAEAGLMAANIPPGALREKFGFMGWKTYAPRLWEKVKEEALSPGRKTPLPVTGADSDPRAVEIARANLGRAGLEGAVAVTRAVFEDAPAPAGSGFVLMNPPYGKRMGAKPERGGKNAAPGTNEISLLYARIGDTFKRKYKGWTGWIFSSNLEAIKHIGLRPFCRIPLKNGPLECRLLGFKLF
jgi:putative N6-adenine-specific DNA methylase